MGVLEEKMNKKKKRFNKLKFIKSLSRVFFSDGMNLSTKNHGDKKKYTRKKKHKKKLDNDE